MLVAKGSFMRKVAQIIFCHKENLYKLRVLFEIDMGQRAFIKNEKRSKNQLQP